MPIHLNVNGSWQEGNKVYVRVAGSWVEADELFVRQSGVWASAWKNETVFVNNSNRTAASIHALMGSPSNPGIYIFENNAIISAGTESYALRTGVFPAGSTLIIINNGTIQGRGGNGGAYNGAGQAGGHALLLDYNCELRNANGYIYGGGGGGGGGYATNTTGSSTYYIRAGGGGGAGRNGGAAGSSLAWNTLNNVRDQTRQPAAGSATAGGLGGQIRYQVSSGGQPWTRVTAGTGGGPGAAGESSSVAGSSAQGTAKPNHYTYAGGAAGRAINRNGKSISITSGNNSTRIVGAIAG